MQVQAMRQIVLPKTRREAPRVPPQEMRRHGFREGINVLDQQWFEALVAASIREGIFPADMRQAHLIWGMAAITALSGRLVVLPSPEVRTKQWLDDVTHIIWAMLYPEILGAHEAFHRRFLEFVAVIFRPEVHRSLPGKPCLSHIEVWWGDSMFALKCRLSAHPGSRYCRLKPRDLERGLRLFDNLDPHLKTGISALSEYVSQYRDVVTEELQEF
jgi:hypothetical protein